MAASIELINYFLPIFSFLLVFIVIYALLVKTEVLGGNKGIMIFISLILASFFIVHASLVDFVVFGSAWFMVIVLIIFMAFLLLAFTTGKLDWFQKSWFAWILLGLIIGFFIIISAFTFNWAVDWGKAYDWLFTDWFGFILLLIIGGIVSWIITRN
ncbi:MAG: hypothetical protein ACP5D2_01955 [Candidatus Nanoarchaeia archaeon]